VSNLRQTFRVAWDNRDPIEVTTNARDIAAVQDYAEDPVTGAFALVHHALERAGVVVPPFDTFVDALDDFELIGGNGQTNVDPTLRAGGETGP
jgi:hypothetical protein